jgi:hypothetical protein
MASRQYSILIVGSLAACGHPSRSTVISTADPAEYPCVLHDPKTLAPDFSVHQSLVVKAVHDGKPAEGQLDAVLQKQGDTLLIVGFGPMNVKAFTLNQTGSRIEFAQFMGPPLPFSPRNVIVDVHRIYFKRLPAPPVPPTPPGSEAPPPGAAVLRGELDGEVVEETWRGGELRQAVFTRPDSALKGAIRVELGPGCTRARCEPTTATLHNEWFNYTLTITNDAYEAL